MDFIKEFEDERIANVKNMNESAELKSVAKDFFNKTMQYKYSYNFSWMGRPIIAYPQDMIAMQELIWNIKPDLIIETGVAHGGSIIYYASLLEMMNIEGTVIGIDVDIRAHNRQQIEKHPMFKRIKLIEGSSIDLNVIEKVAEIAKTHKTVLVFLDSNHSHSHVLKELELYSQFVSLNSFIVVFDTVVEDMPSDWDWSNRWGKGDNPKTAVWKFIEDNKNFEIDKSIEDKLLITVAPDGYLKRIK